MNKVSLFEWKRKVSKNDCNFSIDEFKNLSFSNSKGKTNELNFFLVFGFSYFVVNDLWTLW